MSDEKVTFEELLNYIPANIMRENIIEQLSFIAKNQIRSPHKTIDEKSYTSVYFDGITICYHITVPKGYLAFLRNLDDCEKKEICNTIMARLTKYDVSTVKFVYVGIYEILALNYWVTKYQCME